jgi:hypothetical protein
MNAFPRVLSLAQSGNALSGLVKMLKRVFVCKDLCVSTLIVFFASSGSLVAAAQSGRTGPAAQPLVVQAVDESRRVTLSGNLHPLAAGTVDQGAVNPATPASRMFLVLKRSPEREAALAAAIEALHDRNSPSFHKWMTPEQFGAQWGATDSDIAAATAWLQSHGFTVAGATAGRTAIEFSGTAGQVEAAFHTAIHAYMVHGELHHANVADPQIPAALAPLVAGITTLNDFHPRAQMRKGPRGIFNMATHRIEPDRMELNSVQAGQKQDWLMRPQLTSSGSFGNYLYVGPADAATIYNSPNHVLNPAATGATVDGTGAVIGIIGDSDISVKQLASYRSLFGLTANTIGKIVDGIDPGENSDAVEAYLDTEVANGIAPGAKVYYYEAADTHVNYGVDLASSRAVNDNLVDVLNLSFGECEAELGASANAFYAGLWEQAAAQGISVTVSAGDAGSADCDNPDTQTEAYYGLQVNGLASTPYDTAVGGTDFAVLAGPDGSGADFTNYVSLTSDATTLRSALGAIPEVPWNDAIASFPPTTINASIPFTTPYANIVAGGGGKSKCLLSTTTSRGFACSGGYVKPAWQAAPGVPVDSARDLPDLSLFAANGLDYASWGICTDQDTDSAGNPIEDCTLGSNGLPANEFYISGVGGTSASAPAFAGVLALVRQKTGERQGLANYALYHLARTVPSVFRDVTTGNNAVPCASGSSNCAKNSEGAELVGGYNAGAGYDLASGLGSVDITALLTNWGSAGLATSSTQLTLSPTSIAHGQTVDADVRVTASSGTATGQVALNANANPPSLPVGVAIGNYPLSNGSTGNVAINSLPGGTYKVFATYGGSAAVGQSVSAPVTVTVTPETSSTLVTVASYNPESMSVTTSSTVPYGYESVIQAMPYGNRSPVVDGVPQPDGFATGTVTITEGTENLGAQPIGLNGTAATLGHKFSPGTYPIKAVYHGDNSFDASTGTYSLVISKGATVTTLTANTTSFKGQPITFTIQVSTQSVGVGPSGFVVLKSGSKVLAKAQVTGVSASLPALASATATIQTANLPAGNLSLEAVYTGDGNYAGSTSKALAITGRPAFAIASLSMSLVGEHTTGAAAIPVTSEAGYAGTVKITCALVSAHGAADPPECAMDPASVTLTANGKAQPLLLIFGKGTKLPTGITVGDAEPARRAGLGAGLGICGAVVVMLLLGIPARRRAWKAMLPVLLLLAIFCGMTACTRTPKMISAGNYTFVLTGVDSQDATMKTTATISVRVL